MSNYDVEKLDKKRFGFAIQAGEPKAVARLVRLLSEGIQSAAYHLSVSENTIRNWMQLEWVAEALTKRTSK